VDSELKREVFESFHEMISLTIRYGEIIADEWGDDYEDPASVTKAIKVLDKFRKEF
jgi:hypothetical protein